MGCIFGKCGFEDLPPSDSDDIQVTLKGQVENPTSNFVLNSWKGGGIPGKALQDCDMYTGSVKGGHKSESQKLWWGSHCRAGNSRDGKRKENQDCFGVYEFADHSLLFCVLDGHGPNGAFASHFVRDKFPETLASNLSKFNENAEQALIDTFASISADLSSSSIDCEISGSTVVLAYIRGADVYIANVGDSRAVLGTYFEERKSCLPQQLSIDHKPDLPEEEERIRNSGGRVSEYGVPRIWRQESNTPGIAMSRAFGDVIAQSIGLISIPTIVHHRITSNDQFLVLATDGVWEFMCAEECIDLVYEHAGKQYDPQLVCDLLVQESVERWKMEEEDIIDDTTAVVIFLPNSSR